jgi:prevent-host-death family protein
MTAWSAAEAKVQFSRFLNQSHREPQVVLLRGKPVSVLIDYRLYKAHESALKPGAIGAFLAELSEINMREGELVLPPRRDRPTVIAEDL